MKTEKNATKWIRYFQTNREDRTGREWAQELAETQWDGRKCLAASLAIFQLGESGGGTRLRRFVDTRIASQEVAEGYREAIDLFVAEEQEHARVLGELLDDLQGQRLKKELSNSVFRKVRDILGLGFNLQILLIAELIAEGYYGSLAAHCPDPLVRFVCSRILRDEVKHIQFHADFFRAQSRTQVPLVRSLWELQFQILFLAAQCFVWRTHRRALEGNDCSRNSFTRRSNRACIRFLKQVRGGGEEPSGVYEKLPV